MTGADLAAKDAALNNPAITRSLLQAGSGDRRARALRRQRHHDQRQADLRPACALCHVNVTPTSFQLSAGATALPIGQPRFDGVPNARLNAGAILALTPFVQGLGDGGATAAVLNGWGPGNFDIRALPDNVLEDNVVNPTNNPPI